LFSARRVGDDVERAGERGRTLEEVRDLRIWHPDREDVGGVHDVATLPGDPYEIAMAAGGLEDHWANTRAPASLRINPVQLREQAQPVETTTERIRRALDEIAARKPKEDPIAEESVRLIRGRTANGSTTDSELDPEPDPEHS
jgi:hypothetical protein